VDVWLEGGREGIKVARWLRAVCDVPIVFVTAYGDETTVERIHEQVPGAPVLSKPVYRERLAEAISQVSAAVQL
jgi:CheY-like chemotaxis protein